MKHQYWIIGDPHGKLTSSKTVTRGKLNYREITQQAERTKFVGHHPLKVKTISVGDNGFYEEYKWIASNIDASNHLLLQGNHDCYNYPVLPPHILGDYGVWTDPDNPTFSFFFVRGAFSIDRHMRTDGVDWFRDEELEYSVMSDCLELYDAIKPSIVISHDAPHSIRENLFGISDRSATSDLLQAMLEVHKPSAWYFGHHHVTVQTIHEGTLFQCIDELDYVKLES